MISFAVIPARSGRYDKPAATTTHPTARKKSRIAVPTSAFSAIDEPAMNTQQISLDHLLEADWNASRVSTGLMVKLRRSIEKFGVVENLVARP
jgi:hypothetical protein